MKIFALSLLLVVLCSNCSQGDTDGNPDEKIIIEVSDLDKSENSTNDEDNTMGYLPLTRKDFTKKWNAITPKMRKNRYEWILYSKGPVNLFFRFGELPLVCPGDSIHIKYQDKISFYTGKGSEKLNIWRQLTEAGGKLTTPTGNNRTIDSVEDFLAWNAYVDQKLSIQMSILDSRKNYITPFEYDYLKSNVVGLAENDRIQAFSALVYGVQEKKISKIQFSELCQVFDSTQYKPLNQWLRAQAEYYSVIRPIYLFNRMEVQRQVNFNVDKTSEDSYGNIRQTYYDNAKTKYRGLMRERLLTSILKNYTAVKSTLESKVVQSMLKDYYSQTDFPEYKKWIKSSEQQSK